MSTARRVVNHLVVLLLCNVVCLWQLPLGGFALKLIITIVLFIFFLIIMVAPCKHPKGAPLKQKLLAQGCELLLTGALCSLLQLVISLVVGLVPLYQFTVLIWVVNSIVSLGPIYIMLIVGALLVFFGSKQLSATQRVVVICLCWWPVVNLANFFVAWPTGTREIKTLNMRSERNRLRQSQQVCATRYPLLLVHGIFFRDWEKLGYWGRIPDELTANGATIYYGYQQSSASVEECAQELKNRILEIINRSGCEKVNIIAHSKGGLDSRYAISCLGMDKYVASLTTVNTPHQGCRFARKALDNVPEGVVLKVSKSYNKLYSMLGDDHPDFFSGVSELTSDFCASLNSKMPNCPGVLYQSIGSKMATARSAPFPLNLGFKIVEAADGDGENDGLVSVGSMPWGDFTMIEPVGKKGISHADVIDLMRRDIKGFDVGEMYVGLVAQLRAQGL